MVEFFVGGLAGIDVGVPEFKEAIKHPGEFGCWGAGEQKSSISKQSDVNTVFSALTILCRHTQIYFRFTLTGFLIAPPWVGNLSFDQILPSRDDTMSRLECSRIGRISAVRPKIPKRPFELPSRKTCLSVIGCWGASEPKFCIRATEGHCAATEGLDAALGLERAEFPPKTSLTCAAICFVVR